MKSIAANLFLSLSLLSSPLLASPDGGYGGGIVVEALAKTSVAADGLPIHYLQTDRPEVTALLVEIPPGAETGWHRHPVPVYAYLLQGSIEVESATGDKHTYHAGEAIVEMVGTPHNGINRGTEPVRIVAFYTGEQGLPNTQKLDGPVPPAVR